MWPIRKTRGVDLAVVIIALTALKTGPAWAFFAMPSPDAGGLVGAAIIGALIIARWWRRD